MAVITPTITRAPNGQLNCILVTWTPLANGDTGAPVEFGDHADRCVQVSGTFSVGGSINFEGSNDGTNYLPLTDPQGNAVTKTAAAIEVVEENTRYVRPNVTAGDGSTSLTATLWLRRNR